MDKILLRIGLVLMVLSISLATPSCVNLVNYLQDKQIENHILNTGVHVISIMGQGSGTVIKKETGKMYILTCFHVVEDSFYNIDANRMVTIQYEKQDENYVVRGKTMYEAEIIKVDPDNDMALLQVNVIDNEFEVAKLAKTEPKRGDVVYSVGNPLGVEKTISKGILSTFIEGFYISDNTSTFGNSGGGLYNKKGELIGIPAQVFVYVSIPAVPESGLVMSIELKKIKKFLIPYIWSF